MTTSVRYCSIDDTFVVRINGCQHKLDEESVRVLIIQLEDAEEDLLVIQHCADDA